MTHHGLDLRHVLQAELLKLLDIVAVLLKIDEALAVVNGSLQAILEDHFRNYFLHKFGVELEN